MSVKPTTQAEAVIYYIQEMDVDMVDQILDEKMTLQDLPKQEFIAKLENVVTTLKQHKNTEILSYPGFCNSDDCPNTCKGGYAFVGNVSGHHFNLIFEVSNGNVQDLFECEQFELLNSTNLTRTQRLYIDEFTLPDSGNGDFDPF